MIVNADGNDTTYPITITVADADISTFSVSGLEGLELQRNGDVFSVKNGFDKIGNTETTVTLTLNYQKKSTAGANDTIAEGKDKETKEIKVKKAEKVDDNKIKTDLSSLLTVGAFAFGDIELQSGIGTVYEKDKVDGEVNTSDFVSQFKTEIKKRKNKIEVIEDVEFISVVVSTDTKSATFSFILKAKEEYETDYNDKDTPLKIKVVIGDTTNGQGGNGTWKDTSTK